MVSGAGMERRRQGSDPLGWWAGGSIQEKEVAKPGCLRCQGGRNTASDRRDI